MNHCWNPRNNLEPQANVANTDTGLVSYQPTPIGREHTCKQWPNQRRRVEVY